MKKTFLLIFVILLMFGCNSNEETVSNDSLMQSYDLKDISIDDVISLEIIEYTVGGKEETIITNHDDIVLKYNYLNNYKIGEETNKTCEDNTIVYKFEQNDKVISVEIECNNILIKNNKRYELIKG